MAVAVVVFVSVVSAIFIVGLVYTYFVHTTECTVCGNNRTSELREYSNPYGIYHLCADEHACDARLEWQRRRTQ